MDKSPGEGLDFPVYLIIVLFITASGYWSFQEPFQPFRPQQQAPAIQDLPYEGVEARLWQDPIKVLRDKSKEYAGKKIYNASNEDPSGIRRCWIDQLELKKDISKYTKDDKKVLVLPVIIPGRDDLSDHESRLRCRYAILSALDSAGYIPEDAERLKFVSWRGKEAKTDFGPDLPILKASVKNPTKPPNTEANRIPANSSLTCSLIPYEWYEQDQLLTSRKDREERYSEAMYRGKSSIDDGIKTYDKILVLWIIKENLKDQPISAITDYLKKLNWKSGSEEEGSLHARVIGPTDSDGLKDILLEYRSERPPSNTIQVFSPYATAEPAILQLMSPLKVKDEKSCLITRTMKSDRRIIQGVIKELSVRRIKLYRKDDYGVVTYHDAEKVALITDWDTFYGRALPLTFAAQLKVASKEAKNFKAALHELTTDPGQWPGNIIRVSYLRGLDGKSTAPEKEASEQEKAKKNSSDDTERPEGPGQLDYLRRMTQQLKDFEEKDGKPVRAVGVLGTDVYDKLLILQALRGRFKRAVFFTIDLDARLLHPSQYKWTRNLIIASSFGLSPRPEIKSRGSNLVMGKFLPPPFRDVYQTAVYYAALSAMRPASVRLFAEPYEPYIYEVGRTNVHQLEPSEIDFHRGLAAVFLKWWRPIFLAAFLVGLVTFMRRNIGSSGFRLPRWRIEFLFILMLCALVYMTIRTHQESLEPFRVSEGVSVWPSVILRMGAAVLAFHFLAKTHYKLSENADTLTSKYELYKNDCEDSISGSKNVRWSRIKTLLSYNWPYDEKIICVAALWEEYRNRSRISYSWPRVAFFSLVYIIFAFLLFKSIGGVPSPSRGEASFQISFWVIMICVITLIVLMFYIVDVILLFDGFIKKLTSAQSKWPKDIIRDWKLTDSKDDKKDSNGNDGKDYKAINNWFDMQIIARRTDVIGSLILYPFFVIFLVIISRLNIFDNWSWHPALIVVLGLHSFVSLMCLIVLIRSARKSQRSIIDDLREERLMAPDEKARDALNAIIQDINSIKRGAFAPILQQPLVRAILVGLGGITTMFLQS